MKVGCAPGPLHAPPNDRSWSVLRVRGLKELARYVPAWEELCGQLLEPNVFYEPWMVLPALQFLEPSQSVEFVLVFAREPNRLGTGAQLMGFFPLERRTRYRGLPLTTLRLWQHVHCFLCTPLLRAGWEMACLNTFLEWLASMPGHPPLLELPLVSGDGPFARALAEACGRSGLQPLVSEELSRGLLCRGSSGADYARGSLSGGHRRSRQRLERRLAKHGQLDYVALGPADDVASWITEFLELEAKGWKGRAGTAVACAADQRTFFRHALTEAFRRGRLLMLTLRLNGRPVAQRISVTAGAGSFALKTAYDEDFARFSVGALLEIANIHHFHSVASLQWMDSCTAPDNALINRLWKDRRRLQTVLIALDERVGGLVLALLPVLRWLRRKITVPGGERR